ESEYRRTINASIGDWTWRRELDDSDDQSHQHWSAKQHREKHRADRPHHLAERQIANARRGYRQRGHRCWIRRSIVRDARGKAGRHDFTRYWNTACRLSSGDVTS